jgi:hypothetical protein
MLLHFRPSLVTEGEQAAKAQSFSFFFFILSQIGRRTGAVLNSGLSLLSVIFIDIKTIISKSGTLRPHS